MDFDRIKYWEAMAELEWKNINLELEYRGSEYENILIEREDDMSLLHVLTAFEAENVMEIEESDKEKVEIEELRSLLYRMNNNRIKRLEKRTKLRVTKLKLL